MRRYLAYYFSLGTLSSLVQKSEALRQGKRSEFNVALDEGDFSDPLEDLWLDLDKIENKIQDGYLLSDTFDLIGKSISDKIESGILDKISSSSESDVTDSFQPQKTNIDPEIEILENCYNTDYECTKQDLEAWFPIKTQVYWEHYNKLFNNCKWQLEFSTDTQQIFCNQLGTNKCINWYNDFTCLCKKGFTGDFCQDDLREEMFVSTCLNGDQDCTRQEIKSVFFEPQQKENVQNKINQLFNQCFYGIPGIDECSPEGTKECKNLYNSKKCICNPRFTGENCEIACHDDQIVDPDTKKCTTFTCNSGYEIIFSDFSDHYCKDINECELDNQLCHQSEICKNTEGSYQCICPPGTLRNGPTKDGLCYKPLICDKGFEFDPNSWSCVDINECDFQVCKDENAVCHNFPGGFDCVCDSAGFYEDSTEVDISSSPVDKICVDRDECEEAKLDGTLESLCPKFHLCNNLFGTYSCLPLAHDEESVEIEILNQDSQEQSYYCQPGFEKLENLSNIITCQDIPECSLSESACPKYHTCIELPGSYSCQCAEITDNVEIINFPLITGTTNTNQKIETCEFECISGYDNLFQDETTGKMMCHDINECDYDSCGANADCTNEIGSYDCQCHEGFEMEQGKKNKCIDIDECQVYPNICGELANSHCVNFEGSYDCECNSGFSFSDGICMDINECEEEPDFCQSMKGYDSLGRTMDNSIICNNKIGTADCSCNQGFALSDESKCQDINECEFENPLCDTNHENCKNTIGSYECNCKEGYLRNAETGQCEDINECDLAIDHKCGSNTVCDNTIGSYRCLCLGGWLTADEKNFKSADEESNTIDCLLDMDECVADLNSCIGDHEICVNLQGSFRCDCQTGYLRDEETKECVDIDECKAEVNVCGEHQSCKNTVGSFECSCNPGFEQDPSKPETTTLHCIDINECELNSDICKKDIHDGALCENTIGSYNCYCREGSERNEAGLCVDINECQKSNACSSFGVEYIEVECVNLQFSFECNCLPGYENHDGQCVDIDECKSVSCPENSVCKNLAGDYGCACVYGYERTTWGGIDRDSPCEDINECTRRLYDDKWVSLHDCPEIATCINQLGDYKCECPSGYVIKKDPITNKKYCQDIDECAIGIDQCDQNSSCVNTEGDYKCQCMDGYQHPDNDEDSFYCVDIDECALNLHECGENAACSNIEGGYSCECNPGFIQDLTKPDAVYCIDFNECAQEKDNTCKTEEHQICQNTIGSYECLCQKGFKPDLLHIDEDPNQDLYCVDIDECQDQNINDGAGICGQFLEFPGTLQKTSNTVCKNEIGSYSCECATGFQDLNKVTGTPTLTDSAGEQPSVFSKFLNCQDIDECTLGLDNCDETSSCVNTPGAFYCNCLNGSGLLGSDLYTTWVPSLKSNDFGLKPGEKMCSNINECRNSPYNPCPEHSQCIDEDPLTSDDKITHRCECDEGYTMNESKTKCYDINECQTLFDPYILNKESHKICVNYPGSYQLACVPGYEENQNNDCIKIDYCASNPCIENHGPNSLCESLTESLTHKCSCQPGYEKSTSKDQKDFCVDINECLDQSIISTLPENSICENTEGSYVVSCIGGFRAENRDYRKSSVSSYCRDINECSDSVLNNCKKDQKCVNDFGSYRCIDIAKPKHVIKKRVQPVPPPAPQKDERIPTILLAPKQTCSKGFSWDFESQSCHDIDECTSPETNTCLNTNKPYCLNIEGSHKCYTNKKSASPYRCHQRMKKRNNGGFSCRCVRPYELDADKQTCILDKRINKSWAYKDFTNMVKDGSEKKYKTSCPANTLNIGRLCYIQGPKKMTSIDAENYCSQYKGRMANINVRSHWWILATNTIDSANPKNKNLIGTMPFYVNNNPKMEFKNLMMIIANENELQPVQNHAVVANYYRDLDIVPPQLNVVTGDEEFEFWCEFVYKPGHSSHATFPNLA